MPRAATERWLEGYRRCAALGHDLGPGGVVCVMDREGDAFEIFESRQTEPDADVLVRAKGNRKVAAVDAAGGTGPVQSLDRTPQSPPVLSTMFIAIDRQTARPKRSKRQARDGRKARSAILVVRSQMVGLVPTGNTYRGKPPIWLQAVRVEEERTLEDAARAAGCCSPPSPPTPLEADRTVVGDRRSSAPEDLARPRSAR